MRDENHHQDRINVVEELTVTDRHPADLTVLQAAAALRGGELSAEELTRACLDRIATRDPKYQAWLRVYDAHAVAAARAADARLRAEGEEAPLLCGVPIGLKDVIGVAGQPLTADSAVLEGNVAETDATAWAQLAEQGMVPLGHLHCGEFAVGTWGRNPWNARFWPGGSSSGSAIALASRTVPAALGGDGRGSIRIPASANGVTGVMPTFGMVSTAGCIPISWTFDVVGPMARSAADCAVLLSVMAGADPLDRATLARPPTAPWHLEPRPGRQPLKGTRIGVPTLPKSQLADGVASVFARFQEELVAIGAELVPYDRPANPLNDDLGAGSGWRTILVAEAKAIHTQFADRQNLYRPEFLGSMETLEKGIGSAVDYVQAQMKRGELQRAWQDVFAENSLDAVIEPNQAAEIGKVDAPLGEDDAIATLLTNDLSGAWNDTLFPVVIVPAGHSPTDGGPCGIQFVGLPWHDPQLLQIAIDYQAHTEHHLAGPSDLDVIEPEVTAYAAPERLESGTSQPRFLRRPPITTAVVPTTED